MSEREPLSQQLLDRYQRTITGLIKVEEITLSKDQELFSLDKGKADYPEDVLRIGKVKQCLMENALPLLTSRKEKLVGKIFDGLPNSEQGEALKISNLVERKHLPKTVYESALINLASRHIKDVGMDSKKTVGGDQELSQKFDELLETTGKSVFSTIDIARILGCRVYTYGGTITISKSNLILIKQAALELGMTEVNVRGPRFSKEQAIRIAIKLGHTEIPQEKDIRSRKRKPREVSAITESVNQTEDKKHTVLVKGKKIFFPNNSGAAFKATVILAETSKEKQISRSALAKAVYGDEISLKVAKNRLSVILPSLRRKLEESGLTIISGKITDGEKMKDGHLLERRCYYIADKSDLVPADGSEKKPAIGGEVTVDINSGRHQEDNNGSYSLGRIAQDLGYAKVTGFLYKKIRKIANQVLGRPIKERRPHFTKEEAGKIIEAYKLKKGLRKRSAKSRIPVRENSIGSKQGKRAPIPVGVSQGTAEVTDIKTTDRTSEVPSNVSMWPKPKDAESNPDPSLLTESEIYVITKRLLFMEREKKDLLINSYISTQLLGADEIKSLLNRNRTGLDRKIEDIVGFETEIILSARKKLEVFAADRRRYFDSCGKTAQALLICFSKAEIGNGFWEKLFPAQPVLAQKTMVKRGV